MRLEVHPAALNELHGAAAYYESRQRGLAVRFLDMVADAFDRIEREPYAWAPIEEDVRRCLTRVFPYGVYYSIEREFILVLAIAHLAREPGYWLSRGGAQR